MDSVREFTVNTSSATMLTMRHTPAAHIRIYPRVGWKDPTGRGYHELLYAEMVLDVTEECDVLSSMVCCSV